MQMSLFEEVDIRQTRIEFVVKSIVRSDSIRNYIKDAIKNNDRQELIKLFDESIRTYGFGGKGFDGIESWSWSLGVLRDMQGDVKYKITARELADTALKIYR